MQMDERDVAYIQENFVPLARACTAAQQELAETLRRIAFGELPRPSYIVDDVPFVPPDYFETSLPQEAFVERYCAASASLGIDASRASAMEAWGGYLSGLYGVCLYSATPENIARKSALLERITALLHAVDELDGLERPFSPHFDRERFGRPVSRDTYVTGLRERFGAGNLQPCGPE